MSLLLTGAGVDHPPSGGGSIAFVQGAAGTGSGLTNVLAFPGANAAGNLIVVSFSLIIGGTPAPIITDTNANSYTNLTIYGGPYGALGIAYAMNIAAGANTVTATWGASATNKLIINEFSGASKTAPFDTSIEAGSVSSVLITTVANAELLFGFCGSQYLPSAGTGFIPLEALASNFLTEYEIAGAAGSYTVSCVPGGAAGFVYAAAFKR